MTIGDVIERAAARAPARAAAVDLDGRALSYGELDARTRELAAALDALPGAAGWVLVSLPNGFDAMLALLAALRSRHALAVLHPELPAAARTAALKRLRPVAELVVDDGIVRAQPAPAGAPLAVWAPPRTLPGLRLALSVLTSGSTGAPRTILAAEDHVLAAMALIARRLGYRATDVVAVVPPLSFDFGLYQLLLAADAGAGVLLDARICSVHGAAQAVVRGGATVLPLVPPVLRSLVSTRMLADADTDRVRLVTTTGDLLTDADAGAACALFPRAVVAPMYGVSECKRVAVSPPAAARPPGAVGMPLDATDVAIAGRRVRRLRTGADGELVVAGPQLTFGYDRDPAATARRFAIDPGAGVRLLRTGDRLRLDEDGWLHWRGRGADVIKTAGFRVDPAELERVAIESGAVCEAGAYGRADAARGEVPVLVARPRDGVDEVRARALLADALRAGVPRWASPRIELRTAALPRTANGKVDRAALGARRRAPGADDAPSAPLAPLAAVRGGGFTQRLIHCHTQALLSAFALPYDLTPAEVELLTTVPFGVRGDVEDPHRLLVPELDPDIGLDRACELLGLESEVRWHGPHEGEAALTALDRWLRTGPVVLGPLDLGELPHHPLARTLRGCDHYLVALGRASADGFVVRDPEGFVEARIERGPLLRAWAKGALPEGRGPFTMRRVLLGTSAGSASPPRLVAHLGAHALENLLAAERRPGGGASAYRALAELPLDPTRLRSLMLLLPSAALRYRLAARLVTRVLAPAAAPPLADRWRAIAALIDAQAVTLARTHGRLRAGVASPLAGLGEAAAREARIAGCAAALREVLEA